MLKSKKNIFLGTICLFIIIILLLAGLWPLNFWPKNKVEWLSNRNGIGFQENGIVYSAESLNDSGPSLFTGKSTSIEIWLQSKVEPVKHINHWYAARWHYADILSFYNNDKKSKDIALGQWKSHLIIRSRNISSENHKDYKEIGLHNALPIGKIRFITITSDEKGTTIYLDGRLSKFYPNYTLIAENKGISGQLVLGNSPTGENPWTGNLFGLAIYNQSLMADQVLQHYQKWTKNPYPPYSEAERPVVLYLFDKRQEGLVQNHSDTKNHLLIPTTFKVLQKSILVSPLKEFRLNRSYFKDVVINIMGFVPLGFFFFSYLYKAKNLSRHHIYLITIFLGGGISLTIELLQVYMPTRTYSLTDLICNVLGTVLGVILYQITLLFVNRPRLINISMP